MQVPDAVILHISKDASDEQYLLHWVLMDVQGTCRTWGSSRRCPLPPRPRCVLLRLAAPSASLAGAGAAVARAAAARATAMPGGGCRQAAANGTSASAAELPSGVGTRPGDGAGGQLAPVTKMSRLGLSAARAPLACSTNARSGVRSQ